MARAGNGVSGPGGVIAELNLATITLIAKVPHPEVLDPSLQSEHSISVFGVAVFVGALVFNVGSGAGL